MVNKSLTSREWQAVFLAVISNKYSYRRFQSDDREESWVQRTLEHVSQSKRSLKMTQRLGLENSHMAIPQGDAQQPWRLGQTD